VDPESKDVEDKQKGVLFQGSTAGAPHSSGISTQSSRELLSGGSSGAPDTHSAEATWALTMQSPSLPTQPLMPFSEWNIEFSELRIGIRVGIGMCFWFFFTAKYTTLFKILDS
jgi:hypothetical protein